MTSISLPVASECMCNTRLKRALAANAAFSALCGAVLLPAAPVVAELLLSGPVDWLGFDDIALLRFLGAGLLLFAALVGWTARHARPPARIVIAISIADIGWVIGSAGLLALAAPAFTASGRVAVAAVAALVLVFGTLQLGALRKRG